MALEIFAGAFLSASLHVLFDRLASSEVWTFIGGQKVSEELLLELGMKLLVVDKVLDHAEVKQFTDERVKRWLVRVKNAVYDAEDLLDEITTEALRRKMEAADSQTGPTHVLNSFSTWFKAPLADHQSMESKVKKIIGKLEVLAQAIDVLALKGDGKKLPQRLPSTSLVDECCVYGRDEIKEEMIKGLLSDNTGRNKIDVISIVGMGGAGKTTLAQLLYNDGKVKGHFHLKAWVCVSEEFCLLKVTKSILEGIGSAASSHMQSENLDLLQQNLKDSLGDKKFLLVLDDVWEKCPSEGAGLRIPLLAAWEGLRIPLLAAGEGSKVVVTTRNRNVAKIMRADHTHPLEGLSQAHCWSLFEKLAFENGASGPYPQLESIGRKIVAKCQGLPLAVKALGCLLYSKTDRREWEQILESEIWDLQDHEIVPSLILSYRDLPLHLKRCFAYCSIFPKDHEFDKENLILLWMAEGLLQFSKSNERMGKVGEKYFDELVSKSFFQKSAFNKSCFVMHDLMHDLAQYISREFCIRVEDDKVQEISENTHHSLAFCRTFDRLVVFKRFEALAKIKCLRTYLEFSEEFPFYIPSKRGSVDLHAILSKWRYLRVLSLRFYRLTDLPDSIGELKYLRYLDISYTGIKKLPDSVCYLYNLQTMILSVYYHFIELPERMDKLINLRYLDIRGWREMPSHISTLKSLQKLSNFIVGQKGGSRIGELGELSDIGGRLEISEMQNVECARDALRANMKDKRHLDELSLAWRDEGTNDVIQSGVLNNLQPHPNLKQLTIAGYPGVAFPDWIGGGSSLSNLVTLLLWTCENCSSLPPLGQLPSLKHLSISGLKGVERVGREFYGDASSSIASKPSFPFLQTLRFDRMDNWEQWLCCGCEFHRLQELYIKKCPKLTGKLPEELPSLKKLEIDGCRGLLVASLQVPAIRELKMVGFGELQLKRPASGFTALQTSHIEISNVPQWRQLPLEPHELTITNLDAVESLLEEGIPQTHPSVMHDLKIRGCYFSRPLNRFGFSMVTLKSLQICDCNNVGFLLPELFRCHHPSLEELKIIDSKTDLSLSSSFSLSFSLAIFPRLIHFDISSVDGLESLSISISEGEPTSLRSLEIIKCDDLEYIELPALNSACYSISECWKLKSLALALSSLKRLSLAGCPQLLFHNDGLPFDLRELEIFKCNQLKPQVDWGLQRLASLTEFIIGGCQNVESFPEELLLPPTLTTLEMKYFPNLKSLDGRGLQQLTSLTKLSIRHCPQLQFIPQEGFQHFPSLMELEIEDCPGLQSFGEDILRHLSSLERLSICRCDALQSLTGSGLQHLTSLEKLEIRLCPKLQSLKEVGLPCLAPLKQLHISGLPELQSLTEERDFQIPSLFYTSRTVLCWNSGANLKKGKNGII
ncbi:putative disease resistance RPP13-like protein 1 isoform X2 [Vitis vinifera]|uniref:putative disease resistance RPP13-like protein 1 isoform X2 n=1 Tax=Vitis vinifera TaxID=29760 RepID=UPI00288355EA|nr:putative disease resistance RPP13-like protein 1 isoform X2 [Vitis vinifera]XP_059597040.1 putative disease resistance RPP13-like protein 1 isoform X2 [Vitis vinifera]XP_059597041.1 putative disease resistance RPP13-like protein 1 isoform X2 [Vitis vinifera]